MMTPLDFSLAVGLGLAGSLHCVGMCGPIVLAWSVSSSGRMATQAAAQVFYHGGRLLTYSLLGALAGGFGHMISSLSRIESAASLAAGGLLLVAGLLMLGAIRRPQLIQIGPASWVTRAAGTLLRAQSRWRLGLVMGLLPCGLVYAALFKAMAHGNALDGALAMFGFGLGTAVPLIGLGMGSNLFAPWVRRWGTQVTAVSVVLLGILLLMRGMNAPVTMSQHLHQH
jgi:sulfite exporter TauE/SafE